MSLTPAVLRVVEAAPWPLSLKSIAERVPACPNRRGRVWYALQTLHRNGLVGRWTDGAGGVTWWAPKWNGRRVG